MEAGEALDRRVHRAVFVPWLGLDEDAWWQGFYHNGGYGYYSTNIAHAWEVVDYLLAKGWSSEVSGHGTWRAGFLSAGTGWHRASADTAPLAICRAALLALDKAEAGA